MNEDRVVLLKKAEDQGGDPDISKTIAKLTRRLSQIRAKPKEIEVEEPADY